LRRKLPILLAVLTAGALLVPATAADASTVRSKDGCTLTVTELRKDAKKGNAPWVRSYLRCNRKRWVASWNAAVMHDVGLRRDITAGSRTTGGFWVQANKSYYWDSAAVKTPCWWNLGDMRGRAEVRIHGWTSTLAASGPRRLRC
jgi:hypothetical protein